jgi:branched-chain amino acid transport system ATP-binding protein
LANSLTIEGIDAGYGAVRVLDDVSIRVGSGETVVLLGTNGNGKSTLMKSIMGIVRPGAGRIVAEIEGERHDLVGRATEDIVDLGIALVPEGRRLFRARRSRSISRSASKPFRASPSAAASSRGP